MRALVILALLLSGCLGKKPYCDLPREVASTEAFIIGGEVSTDRRNVVLVLSPVGSCTGTIVGPHSVLTAAHCVDGEGWDASDFRIGIRYEHGTNHDWVLPVDFEWNTRWQDPDGLRRIRAYDLAMLYTDEELPGPHISIAETPDGCYAGLINQGYGLDETGLWTGQLSERVIYETFHSEWLIFGSFGACSGDSGGPLYAVTPTGLTQVGVTSGRRRPTPGCQEGLRGATTYVNLHHAGAWVKERIR